MVYDDDDEYESVSTVPDKKVLKEKKESEGQNIIDKAPLKEDEKVIIYKEQDEQTTSVRFNYVTKELVRENDSLIMNYIFFQNSPPLKIDF